MWDPASDYITTGQDEPGYRSWYGTTPHPIQIKAFNAYLNQWGVGGIVPTWQLLRTATAWQHCGAQPFEVPPMAEWPHIVQTLRYIHDYVIPAVGPVEAGFGLSQSLAEPMRGRRPGERAQTLFGGRPGSIEADHARAADARPVRRPRPPRPRL